MPRLIDDIRATGKLTMPHFVARQSAWARHTEQLWELLRDPQLPVVRIDNVADYYYSGTDQENWDLSKDFPNLAPPYPLAWFEHKLPRVIRSAEKGDTDMAAIMGTNGRAGMLMIGSTREEIIGTDIPASLHWALTFEVFIDYGRGYIEGPHGSIHLGVDADGALVDKPWMRSFADGHEAQMHGVMCWTHPALLAISFMHCRNVRVLDEPVPRPLAKKYHARTGNWPVRYRTLEIHPLKEILRREGNSESTGLRRALHICRGHFRDYRQGKGLFGKYHQVVWTPSIVRGTKGEAPPPREVEIKL